MRDDKREQAPARPAAVAPWLDVAVEVLGVRFYVGPDGRLAVGSGTAAGVVWIEGAFRGRWIADEDGRPLFLTAHKVESYRPDEAGA